MTVADSNFLRSQIADTFEIQSSKTSELSKGSVKSGIRVSRDEMNLAEFPLTVLSTRIDSDVKTLEFSDTVRGKNGEVINRKWIITGADKFGLPTASDDEVLLGLLKLSVDSGFTDRKVYFSRYELLKALRWTTEGRSYTRLQKALDRLSGVRIKTTNGFYDIETKSHSTRNFGIIDAYEINDGRNPTSESKPSFFIWSETIFHSFQTGFIKKLDLDFLLDLKSAVAKRLYRYLDKHFWYRSKVQQNLFILAHEKIGISRNYSYASQLKQQLEPAIEELVERGFLLGVDFLGKGEGTEVIFYSASGAKKSEPALSVVPAGKSAVDAAPPIFNVTENYRQTSSSRRAFQSADVSQDYQKPVEIAQSAERYGSKVEVNFDDLVESIRYALVQRGIRPTQLNQLLANRTTKQLKKVEAIINYFDELLRTNSSRISRSPVGFLYSAVSDPDRFILPKDSEKIRVEVKAAPERRSLRSNSEFQTEVSEEALRSKFLTERKRELELLRDEVEPEIVAKITREVEAALRKLSKVISPARFEIALKQTVDDKLARLLGLPEFEEWKKRSL